MALNPNQFEQLSFPGMEHLQPAIRGPEGDPALAARRQKMRANRAGERPIPSRRDGERTIDPPEKYGIHYTGLGEEPLPVDRAREAGFGTWDRAKFQAMGRTTLVPYNKISSSQHGVVRERVKQIIEDPQAGVDPHLPREYPTALDFHGNYYLTNGNHRTAAELAKGALWVPMKTVPVNQARTLGVEYHDRRNAQIGRAQSKRIQRAGGGEETVADALSRAMESLKIQ